MYNTAQETSEMQTAQRKLLTTWPRYFHDACAFWVKTISWCLSWIHLCPFNSTVTGVLEQAE